MQYFIKVTPNTFPNFFEHVSKGLPRPIKKTTPFFYAGGSRANVILLMKHGIGFASEAKAQACLDANINLSPDNPNGRVNAASVRSLAEMPINFNEIPANLSMSQHLALFHQELGTELENWPNAISWLIAQHFANTSSLHTQLVTKVRASDLRLNHGHLRKMVQTKIRSPIPLKTMGVFTTHAPDKLPKDVAVMDEWIAEQTNSLFNLSAVCFGLPFSAWTPNCGTIIDYVGLAAVYEDHAREMRQTVQMRAVA